MKSYNFSFKPSNIFKVEMESNYYIKIITVLKEEITIPTETKEDAVECVKQLKDYCNKEKIGVFVYGYDEEE